MGQYLVAFAVFVFALMFNSVHANELRSLTSSLISDNRTKIEVTFSDEIELPSSFSIDNPARVVLDFPSISNGLAKKTEIVKKGAVQSIATVEAGERTRMVLNLLQSVPYSIDAKANMLTIIVDGIETSKISQTDNDIAGSTLQDIDFRRGNDGEGMLIITLDKEGAGIDVSQNVNNIIIDIANATLPSKLHRRLDVTDFGTPVEFVETRKQGDAVQLSLTAKGKFEHLAYQADNKIIIEVRGGDKEIATVEKDKTGYTGDKLSLNFQNIEVRAVLQLLADYTQLNLVTSDTVQGNLTLRLKNVPWDQALDIILKTKGLGMRQNGNVMLVAPAAEIAAREKQELEAKNQLIELEPLYSEVVEVNFAKASELAAILATEGNDGDTGMSGFLSERGSITVDERTNSLLMRDTADNLAQIKGLIKKLDVAIRQVLIESRIVIASNDFANQLGVKFGSTAQSKTAGAGVAGNLSNLSINRQTDTVTPISSANGTTDLNVNLPTTTPAAGTLALALAKLPFGAILGLELQAMQAEGQGEVVSSPRVITSNQSPALIEQGTEIPYQEASASGAAAIAFKKAVLSLEVTPQITPNDQIIMDLKVNKDEVVFDDAFAVPSISTKTIETQVLVDNGETVVLGGVYEQNKSNAVTRVPFFGELPYVGVLFRRTAERNDKTELLVFVTPKIIKEGLSF